ncbi:MAG: membrane bound O-acyl transferase family-domain-containing protein [Isosphaeraceae bacterium]
MAIRREVLAAYPHGLAWALMIAGPVASWCAWPWLGSQAFTIVILVALLASWKAAALICLPRESWGDFPPLHLLAFLVWPGMQPRQFLRGAVTAEGTPVPTWAGFARNLIAALALLLLVPRLLPAETPRPVRVAIAVVGLGMLTLFARFDLATLIFRAMGFAVEKVFACPLAATSLGDFWGHRWNRIVSGMLREVVYLPLARRLGARAALFAVFLYSGLYHEVVSVLAGSGYGGPALYFLLQGLGVAIENTRPIRHLIRRRIWLSRAWTLGVVVGPIGLILHPGFVEGFLVPMAKQAGVPGLREPSESGPVRAGQANVKGWDSTRPGSEDSSVSKSRLTLSR